MKYLVLSIFLFMVWSCRVNNYILNENNDPLYPIGQNGLWGYANNTGAIVIPYQYEYVSFFCGNRAAIKMNGKFGFINRDAKYLIKPRYDSVVYFNNENAIIVHKGKNFVIDKNGKKLNIGLVFESCGSSTIAYNALDIFDMINNQYILKAKELENQKRLSPLANFTAEDFTFDDVIPFSSRSLVVKKNNKYCVYVVYHHVGLNSDWVDEIIPIFHQEVGVPSNKLEEAKYAKFRIGTKWGIMSDMGHFETDPEFLSIQHALGIYYFVEYLPKHWGTMSISKRYFKN